MLLILLFFPQKKVELSKNIWTYNQLFSNDSAASKEKVNSGLGICCLDVKPPNAK